MKSYIGFAMLMLAAAAACAEDDSIPSALQASRYEELWTNSPFSRSLNAAASYVITGVARINGVPLVTVANTATGERFTLSTEKNSQGWRLINIRPSKNPKNVQARVSIADEEMTVRFDDSQLTAKALAKASQGGQPPRSNPVPDAQNSGEASEKDQRRRAREEAKQQQTQPQKQGEQNRRKKNQAQ